NLKKNVDERQAKLSQAKGEYRTALKNLEMISDEIHERRRSSMIGPRRPGVGAEGDSSSGDDISSFKMESDGISSEVFFLFLVVSFLHHFPPAVASECFDDEPCRGSSIMSEEDSETRSTGSLGSTPSSPQELLSPCIFASSSSSSGTSSSDSPSPTPSSSSSTSSPALVSRPCSLDLPSTVSLSDFGLISPVLGPRSECSGASSPECDLERAFFPLSLNLDIAISNLTFFFTAGDRAEGAEGDLDNPPTGNVISTINAKKNFSLEARFSFLNLRRPRVGNTKNKESCPQKTDPVQTDVLVKRV
ncbi:hypothetical protein GOODEAATRI_004515, partial [Goodea atripinnis]